MTTIERIRSLRGPLRITCYACGHEVTWTVDEAIRRLGGWRQPYDARVVLKCTECGVKGRVNFASGSVVVRSDPRA